MTFKNRHHTEETKRKISSSKKGKNKGIHFSTSTEFKKGHITWLKGKHQSEEAKQKLRLAHLGKKASEETRRKLSLMRLGKHTNINNNGANNSMFGKHHSEEAKQKMRTARLQQKILFKDTSIEVALQNKLRELNIPFVTHKTLIGRTQPDIFIEPNIAIYCDGCYYHGCEQCFDKNEFSDWIRARQVIDVLTTQKLVEQSFKVFRFWEHDIKKNVGACVAQLNLEQFKEKL